MDTTESLGYLKGLLDGMDLDESKKETKIYRAMIGVLENLAEDVNDLTDGVEMMADQLDAVDEDLGDVEEYLYGDEDDDDEFTNKLLGEWAYEQFDNIPSVGDSFEYDNVAVTVSEMRNNRILRLRVRRIDEGGEEK